MCGCRAGEYCVRGGIIDLFAMGSVLPYRLDLFDDEIETIATFDVDTQRTLYPVPEIRLLPAREFPMESRPSRFRQNFRDRFEGDPSVIYLQRVNKARQRIELHRQFRRTATLFDYLPKHTACLITRSAECHHKDAASRYKLLRGDPQRPLLEPRELFMDAERFFIRGRSLRSWISSGESGATLTPAPPPPFRLSR
jgi:transcription-repair coupling factor (superfamily II helicase)